MKPAQVLDYQRGLRDYLRTDYYQSYLQRFLTSLFTKGGMVTKGLPEGYGAQFANEEIRVLESAYAFHVDAEMMPLIRHASTGLDDEVTWAKEVFPTERGFLMFDEPMAQVDVRGRHLTNAALTWHWGAGPDGHTPGVTFAFYTRLDDEADDVNRDIRESGRGDQLRRLGPLHINHLTFTPWGTSLGPPRGHVSEEEAANYAAAGDIIEVGAGVDNVLRHVYAILALMGQTVTDTRDAELSPMLRRHLGKARIPARVVVITLRRTAGSRQQGESLIEWSFRWVTRGHWRKQPCGPGRADIRVIWIAPFVKGPADKPLHISDKVYDLRR